MKIEARYFSIGGNTKRLIEAVCEVVDIKPLDITNKVESCDVLFFATALYKFTIDKAVKTFLRNLTSSNVKQIVCFSTSASNSSIVKKVKKQIKDEDIVVLEKNFSTPGEFLKANKGRPNEDDLNKAKEFTKELVLELSKLEAK